MPGRDLRRTRTYSRRHTWATRAKPPTPPPSARPVGHRSAPRASRAARKARRRRPQRPPAVRVRPRDRQPVGRGRRRGGPRLARRAARGRRGAVRPRAPDALGPARAVQAQRLQAAHRGRARGALPAGDARRRPVDDRLPLRARDRLARPARDEPRRAALRAAAGGVPRHGLPGRRLRGPAVRARAARGDRRRLPQRRDRRGVRAREGHAATATCAAPPSAIPSGTSPRTSATRRPSTARRSPRTAISPLHRMSFQSIAYTQLPLAIAQTRRQTSDIRTRPPRARGRAARRWCPRSRRSRRSAASPPRAARPCARTATRARAAAGAGACRADGVERRRRPGAAAADARLDLAEDQRSVAEGDHVELAAPGAVVALEHGVAGAFEVLAREPLAERAEAPPRVRSGAACPHPGTLGRGARPVGYVRNDSPTGSAWRRSRSWCRRVPTARSRAT